MKIAFLQFGMPRFYSESIFSMTRHFKLGRLEKKNIFVDTFCHFWNKIGYTPQNDVDKTLSNYNESILHYRYVKNFNADVKIDDYSVLEEISTSFQKIFCTHDHFSHSYYYGTPLNTGDNKHWLYQLGQIVSSQYVSRMTIKKGIDYDMYILSRTDMFYKPWDDNMHEIYNTYFEKISAAKGPCMLVFAIHKLESNTYKFKENIEHVKWNIKDKNKDIIRFNDWFIVCNKEALTKIFTERINNYKMLLFREASNLLFNKENKVISFSPQICLGELTKYYGVELYNTQHLNMQGIPVIKIIDPNPDNQKESDKASKKRIFFDTYENMYEQYNKIISK